MVSKRERDEYNTSGGQRSNLLYGKARNQCIFSVSTKLLYDHTVSLARALQQELHGAIQEEKNNSQYYCSVYTFALPLSVP